MSTTRIDGRRSRASAAAFFATVIIGLAAPAQAEDWYVDAVFGDDLNDGRSTVTAWRTLTHSIEALTLLPFAERTLHVAPGTYDPALGETFPLLPPPLLRVVGTEGPASTIVRGANAALFVYASMYTFDERSGLTGLTLRDAVRGVALASIDSDASFTDLVITNMSGPGVRVFGADPNSGFAGRPRFERCDISFAVPGVLVTSIGAALAPNSARALFVDTRVHDCPGNGVEVMASVDAVASLVLERCRVDHNGLDGLHATAYGGVTSSTVEATACLFAFNQRHGAFGGTGMNESVEIEFYGCTLAQNIAAGGYSEHGAELTFTSSIVAGNGDDVYSELVHPRAFFSDCPQGDFAGWPGCIAADPSFIAPLSGDFRLSFGSPCIESGDSTFFGALDLAARPRNLDGDLDTNGAVDMGALEFETLTGPQARALGQRADYTVWGTPGSNVTLLFTFAPPATPVQTDYGVLALARPQVRFVRGLDIPVGGPPLSWALDVPNDPAWVGSTLAAQALIESSLAPWGLALSSLVAFSIDP